MKGEESIIKMVIHIIPFYTLLFLSHDYFQMYMYMLEIILIIYLFTYFCINDIIYILCSGQRLFYIS